MSDWMNVRYGYTVIMAGICLQGEANVQYHRAQGSTGQPAGMLNYADHVDCLLPRYGHMTLPCLWTTGQKVSLLMRPLFMLSDNFPC